MINLLIYAIVACVLFVIFYKEKESIVDSIKSNYAEFKLELLIGEDNEWSCNN